MSTNPWAIRVPASSANLGAGFDVLGMAVTLHAEVGVGPVPNGARIAEPRHPASVAFRRAGITIRGQVDVREMRALRVVGRDLIVRTASLGFTLTFAARVAASTSWGAACISPSA